MGLSRIFIGFRSENNFYSSYSNIALPFQGGDVNIPKPRATALTRLCPGLLCAGLSARIFDAILCLDKMYKLQGRDLSRPYVSPMVSNKISCAFIRSVTTPDILS